ncbi:MAG: hypothetical protein RIT43_1090 [Bacteroidota bacterium]
MERPVKEVSLRRMRWLLFLLSYFKIPLIGFVRPKLKVLNEEECSIMIPLRRRSKNHLNSMYFGALAIGADLSGGLHAFYFSECRNLKIALAFKDVNATFLKRAESDILFKSVDGALIKSALDESMNSGKRINQPISIKAMNTTDELVAEFVLTVSIKVIQ